MKIEFDGDLIFNIETGETVGTVQDLSEELLELLKGEFSYEIGIE